MKHVTVSYSCSLFFYFPFSTCCLYCHCSHSACYSLSSSMSLLSSRVLPFYFIPFSLCFFSLFLCFCLICLCIGVGSGSSPTSSQNEALPPSSDWPVSAYTSSFSLSSPETDDTGTWFTPNTPPHTPTPQPPLSYCNSEPKTVPAGPPLSSCRLTSLHLSCLPVSSAPPPVHLPSVL